MALDKIKRRDFLKIMGWGGAGATLAGCDMPTTVTLEEGKEEVVSYLVPEEYVIPGIGVWYASTCQQCAAGCGVHGRVREGRVLKLEGNPESAVNSGALCQMGQSALQTHYNPDRIQQPLLRSGGALKKVSWDEALAQLQQKAGGRSAWVTGTISGHQAVLLDAYVKATQARHYPVEVVGSPVWNRVCQDMLGDANPRLRIDEADLIVSFGADFLGTWNSPVHFSRQYARFRQGPKRGMLIQIEPAMTLTGANADLWLAIRPGTEGVFALGVANVLVDRYQTSIAGLPADAQKAIRLYTPDHVKDITGVSVDQLMKVAELLKKRGNSLVLAGSTAEGHSYGYQSVASIMLLNILLGNVGKTLQANVHAPAQLAPRVGNTANLVAFAEAAAAGNIDVAFFYGSNPLYLAPQSLGLKGKLDKVGFKVALSSFMDETTAQADLVLPLASALEDWGSHVGAYQNGELQVSIQQPLMEKLYPETRGFGDVMLGLLKQRQVREFALYEDYYAYLRNAVAAMPAALNKAGGNAWNNALQHGVVALNAGSGALRPRAVSLPQPEMAAGDDGYPYHLVPSARLGLWDGRHANIPWLQEAPDQITKVVWDSWVELHPTTAAKLGVARGDTVKIASKAGAIEAKVYVYKGIHPDAIGVPLGQGHDEYGRYAKGRGVNPLSILNDTKDQTTGELALHATRVQLSRTAGKPGDKLVLMGGSESQLGRKMVATVKAEVFARSEGDA